MSNLPKLLCAGVAFGAMLAVAASGAATAQLRLGTPDTIAVIQRGTGDVSPGCGLTADFAFPGHDLRVEILGWPKSENDSEFNFTIKTFAPTQVTPSMRDIWLRTASVFTLGRFRPGYPNAKGFLESRGTLDRAAAAVLFDDLINRRTEISFIMDGPLPHSRVPVALPEPLPADVKTELETCVSALLPKSAR